MMGTRIEVKTRKDIDRIRGEGSLRSFWKVLMDSSNSSELEAALQPSAPDADHSWPVTH